MTRSVLRRVAAMKGEKVPTFDTGITVTLSIRTESEANMREHWAKKANRAREQRWLTCLLTQQWITQGKLYRTKNPVRITLTRIGVRDLDTDNLANSFKHVQDGIADALGIDDGDSRLTWLYRQERGKPKEYAVRVGIEGRKDA